MSNIKSPEEFYEQEVGLNAELGYQPTSKESIIKAMKSYHEYAMKQKIEELKMKGIVAGYDDYGVGYKEGIDKAIEIIRGDGN